MNDSESVVISKRLLQQKSKEVCEFCEKSFNNRYDSIIHNATHIIIPLLNLNLVNCTKCNFFCTTKNELHQHIALKHPVIIKTERLNFWDDIEKDKSNKCNIDPIDKKIIPVLNNLAEDTTKNKDKKDKGIVISDICSNSSKNKNKSVKAITKDDTCSYSNKQEDRIKGITLLENTYEDLATRDDKNITKQVIASQCNKVNGNENKESVRDRFQFESDDIFDNLDNSLEQNYLQQAESESIVIRKLDNGYDCRLDQNGVSEAINETKHNCVDYDILKERSVNICKFCRKSFSSRFDLIVHKQKHIIFKRHISGLLCLYCDKYIAGNFDTLSTHIRTTHYKIKEKYKLYCTGCCTKCGLQYRNYKHHVYNYHIFKSCKTNTFVNDKSFRNHMEKCLCHTHVLFVCIDCYTGLFDDKNYKCRTLDVKSYNGRLQKCKCCDKNVYEIRKVKVSCKVKKQRWPHKPLTNEGRLKNIQARLKRLNIMSKM